MDEVMDFTTSEGFKFPLKVLRFTGVSFRKNEGFSYKVYAFLIQTILVYGGIILQLSEIFRNTDSLESMLHITAHCGEHLLGIAKVTILMLNKGKIRKYFKEINQFISIGDEPEDEKLRKRLIRNAAVIAHRQGMVFFALCAVAMLLGILNALVKRIVSNDPNNWELPFLPFTILNITYSPNFEIVYLHQSMSVLCFGCWVYGADFLIVGILVYICLHFTLLNNFIRKIPAAIEKDRIITQRSSRIYGTDDKEGVPWQLLQKQIRTLVQHHGEVLRKVEEFNKLFRYILLMFVFLTIICNCAIIFNATKLSLENLEWMVYLVFVVSVSYQTFMLCYWSNEVTLQSTHISDACYNVAYAVSDIWFQKSMALIIQRCQVPLLIKAGGIITVSLDTFVAIMKTSYSYFMVLKNVQ